MAYTAIVVTEGEAKYEAGYTNASIGTSASETFFSSAPDKQGAQQFGSFNYLEIVNDDSTAIDIDLDGLSTRRRRLFGKSTLVISAKDNVYFNTVKVTNTSASATIAASGIKLIGRIVR